MSLFSLNNILLNESDNNTSTINIDDIGYVDNEFENYSFVQEGYDFILEMGRDYMNAEKTFLESVLGSYGDNEIITESFSDFFNKIKDTIKKFIDWIKKVFKEFITKINALVSSEKYIKKNHKLLDKFDSNDEFDFNGYKFDLKSNIPLDCAYKSMFDGENNGENYLNKWYDNDNLDSENKEDRESETKKLNADLTKKHDTLSDGLEDFYDDFRAKVIGQTGKIYSSDYSKELFKVFRNDNDTPEDITIDSTYVHDAYRRFDNHKDTIKDIEKTQKAIIKDYEALEKYLDRMLKVNKSNNIMTLSYADASSNDYTNSMISKLGSDTKDKTVYNSSTVDKMNSYLKTQSAKVNNMCSIHTQAFSAKLEAAKDQFKQDKKIIYKALQQVIKNHSNSN